MTDEGRQLLHWDATLLSTVIDSLKSKSSSSLATSESTRVDHDGTLAERRSVKESNFTRLRYVLERPMLRSLFREFLRGSYCEENLSFWLDVGDFKRKFAVTSSVKVADDQPAGGKSHGQEAMEKHHDYLVRLGFRIYNNYLAPSCPAELSIDSRLRSDCVKFLDEVLATGRTTKAFSTQLEPEHKSAFDTSQLQRMINQYESISASVFKTMALDSIPKVTRFAPPFYYPFTNIHSPQFCESSTYIDAHNQLELEDSGSDIKFLTPSDETPDPDFSGIYISVSQVAGESKSVKCV